MKFGINIRKKLTGAEVYVRVFQISSILPVLFVLAASGYTPVLANRGIFSFLFRLGLSAVPRPEALALSLVYRRTVSEVILSFALLVIALAFGLAANRLLRGSRRTARVCRVVLLALVGADLVLRLLPLDFNGTFGLPAAILGFAIRLVCLVFIALDLRADSREAHEAASAGNG